jgi:hypothetical protein
MAMTPDGRTLIVAECMGHRLSAFDIRADGALAHRRVYARLPGDVNPDGIALDAEGAVWLANPEGRYAVKRVREGGEIVDRVELDTHAYAVALGGPQTAAPLHQRLGYPRSGADRTCCECHSAGRRGRSAGGGHSLIARTNPGAPAPGNCRAEAGSGGTAERRSWTKVLCTHKEDFPLGTDVI